MGGTSYQIKDPIHKLRVAASSCFFGEPQYYHRDEKDLRPSRGGNRSRLTSKDIRHLRSHLGEIDPQEWRGMSPTKIITSAIDGALNSNPEETLRLAAELRQKENIRTTPQVILVRAANHPKVRGTGLVRKYAKDIVQRADEPSVGLSYQIAVYGRKGIPNSLKKAWKDALENFGDYQLAKYRMERNPVKTVDVVNLVHPKSKSIDKLAKGELKTTGSTWESIISEKGSNQKSWEESLEVMGEMATLRNVRNLLQNNVSADKISERLRKKSKKSRQIPFRYYSAYNAVKEATVQTPPQVLDAIEEGMINSLSNLPELKGKSISLCDNSGSARGSFQSKMGTVQVSTIANLSGVLTGRVSDEGYVGVFGDKLQIEPIRKTGSILDQLETCNRKGEHVGAGTEHGIWLFFDQAIRNKDHYDRIFVYSDMQAGHGGLYGHDPSQYSKHVWPGSAGWGSSHIDVASLVSKYRAEVNPDVFVYMVQVAGYQDTIMPEYYDRTYILGGWSDSILKFAAKMENSYKQN